MFTFSFFKNVFKTVREIRLKIELFLLRRRLKKIKIKGHQLKYFNKYQSKSKVLIYFWLSFGFGVPLALIATVLFFYGYLTPLGHNLRDDFIFHGKEADGRDFIRHVYSTENTFVRSQNLPRFVFGAIIVSEDSLFFKHHGFDFKEIQNSLGDAFWERAKLRGASTISQQVVKNIYLNQSRSYFRKFKEAIYTYKLEKRQSKEEILNAYLNLVEWAPGIYGLDEASHFYFGVSPELLTPEQASLLAFFIPSPKTRGTAWKSDQPSNFRDQQVRWTLMQMALQGYFKKEEQAQYLENFQITAEMLSNEVSNVNLKQEIELENSNSNLQFQGKTNGDTNE